MIRLALNESQASLLGNQAPIGFIAFFGQNSSTPVLE